jgi:hypothetical protein
MKLRRLLGVIVSLSMILGLYATIYAPTAAAACSNLKIVFHEDANQQDNGGTLPYTPCYANNEPDMNTVGATGNGCSSSLVNHSTWDNCVSSFTIVGGGLSGGCYHYGVNIYIDPNYGSLWGAYWGPFTFNGGLGLEDQITSFKFKYRATCPSSPVGPTQS